MPAAQQVVMAGRVNHEDMKNEKWASTASGDKGSRWSVFFPRQMTCGLNVHLEQLGNSELRFVSLFHFVGSLEFRVEFQDCRVTSLEFRDGGTCVLNPGVLV